VGDAFGKQLAKRVRSGLLTVGRSDADVRVGKSELSARGIQAIIVTPKGECELSSPLVGEHNLENLLVALGVLLALGHAPGAAALALSGAPQVPGRLERCEGPDDDILVAVDYAHTPDALRRVLSAVRALTAGRVLCVFGCGGDRDPSKRAPMGEAVGRGADLAFVTSDNPRSEAPLAIIDAIVPGLRKVSAAFEVEPDRARAIEQAVLAARPGDVVLLAGKGHEDYQLIGGEKRHFDDREEARRALALRRQARQGGS
jgi:UDP-N-acetylmuramoyl-L-alanyl-D-glutamate--2,6-diaminopimelate ligase